MEGMTGRTAWSRQTVVAAEEADVLKAVQHFQVDWDRMKRTIPPGGLTLHTPGGRYRIRDSMSRTPHSGRVKR